MKKKETIVQVYRSKNDPNGNGRYLVCEYESSRQEEDGRPRAAWVAAYLDQKPARLAWSGDPSKLPYEMPEVFIAPSAWLAMKREAKRLGILSYE